MFPFLEERHFMPTYFCNWLTTSHNLCYELMQLIYLGYPGSKHTLPAFKKNIKCKIKDCIQVGPSVQIHQHKHTRCDQTVLCAYKKQKQYLI